LASLAACTASGTDRAGYSRCVKLDDLRREYAGAPLTEAVAGDDPLALFERWFQEAVAAEVPFADGMVLATSAPDGQPSARTVLLKRFDARGFAFYTSYESRKAGELEANPSAALLFWWPVLHRQVRVEGKVARCTDEWEGRELERPASWGGYCLVPQAIEFWQGRPDRLHDRLRFRSGAQGWTRERLCP
jgi:pyridoxamine 5'-phosphate oxidase